MHSNFAKEGGKAQQRAKLFSRNFSQDENFFKKLFPAFMQVDNQLFYPGISPLTLVSEGSIPL